MIMVLDEVAVDNLLRFWGYTRKVNFGPQMIWGLPSKTLQGVQINDVLYYFEYPKRGYNFNCVHLKSVTLNFYFLAKSSPNDFCAVCDKLGQVTVYKRPQ